MCTGENRIITGIPTGGTFSIISGPGAINGNTLTALDDGIIVVQYSVTQNECTGLTHQNITSNQSPASTITSNNAPMCSGEMRVLTATPQGGIFSVFDGPGTIIGNTLTANGNGTIVIHYSISENGCIGISTQNISSTVIENPSITSSDSSLCTGDTRTLTAIPFGGIFSVLNGPGILSNSILTATGPGNIVIQYLTCSGTIIQNIVSNPSPMPMITSSDLSMCTGTSRELTASTSGGTFSILNGPGFIDGGNLIANGEGNILIEYNVIENGCMGADTQYVSAFNYPTVNIFALNNILYTDNENVLYQWVDCDNNFEVIQGETNQSFSVVQSGNYALIGTLNNCSDTSMCINVEITNVFEPTQPDYLKIYPNPTDGVFSIQLEGKITEGNITVRNVVGNVLAKAYYVDMSIFSVDLSQYPGGLYIIEFDHSGHLSIFKVLKF